MTIDFLSRAARPRMVAARRFLGAQEGTITPLSMFMFMMMLMLGGFALDMSQHVAARTKLQITADSVAHAALVSRRNNTEAEARAVGLSLLEANMPARRYGTISSASDIEFGRWTQGGFEPHDHIHTAARVVGLRNGERGNALRTFLMRVLGVNELDVAAATVFTTYQPICIEEGFAAEGKVDVQSNNNYLRGFCIHSNDYVRINQNNYFEEGTIVSMPDLDLLQLPNSGFERNEGLEMALREGWLDIKILRELDRVIEGTRNGDPEYRPDYVSGITPVDRPQNKNNNTLDTADLIPGRIHEFTCNNQNGQLNVPNGTVISNVVIITNCQLSLGQDVRLEDVRIMSTNTTRHAVSGASGVSIGRDDDCAEGGGAQILTLGDMSFPANLGVFGGQLIARGNIDFAARADGVQGASMIAGGEIDGTSNSTMARCNRGMDDNLTTPYYRMAM